MTPKEKDVKRYIAFNAEEYVSDSFWSDQWDKKWEKFPLVTHMIHVPCCFIAGDKGTCIGKRIDDVRYDEHCRNCPLVKQAIL